MTPRNFVFALICAAAVTGSANAQTLLAGYDFQTTTNGGTASAVNPNAPLVYFANVGTQAGTAGLYLDGTNGSSAFTSAATNPQVTAFSGTNLNTAGTSLSTVTTSPAAVALANSSANGFNAVFTLSMSGYQNLTLSFATQRSGTGFNNNELSYSLDGVNFTSFATAINPATAFAVLSFDLSGVAALNDAASVYIRYTLNGASATTGNNRLDNVQFNATPVPEPSTVALGVVGLVGLVALRRRK